MQRAQRVCGGFLLPQDGAVNLLTGTSFLCEPLAVLALPVFVGSEPSRTGFERNYGPFGQPSGDFEASLKMDGAAR
jgi:hypothetical protein